MAFLTNPSSYYQDSHLEALREYEVEGRHREQPSAGLANNFSYYIQQLLDQADRTLIKPGQVPTSVFWLVDEDDYIGRIFVRHTLDEALLRIGGHIGYTIRPSRRRQGYGKLILKYCLEPAKKLGLERVLLTCDEDNYASRTIIESNGGILEKIAQIQEWPAMICHYWIQL